MASNEEADRLNTAEEYLLNYPSSSQEFDAALEHVLWVHKTKPEFKVRCANLLFNVVERRKDEQHTMAKLAAVR